MKMYIAVLDKVPDHMVPVLVAHAVLGAHLEFKPMHDNSCNDYNKWLQTSFRKVVLKVNRKEFEKISSMNMSYLAHESTVLSGEESCVVLCPRYEYPNVIKFAKMWKPDSHV